MTASDLLHHTFDWESAPGVEREPLTLPLIDDLTPLHALETP